MWFHSTNGEVLEIVTVEHVSPNALDKTTASNINEEKVMKRL